MTAERFSRVLIGMMAGLLIWAAHLASVYGVTGLACARLLGDAELLGFNAVRLIVVVLTVAALLATAWVMVRALTGRGPGRWSSAEPRRFIDWTTAAIAGLSMVAILWGGLPALQVAVCT